MARGTRSRASRAERRLQKERAASALEHGLPAPAQGRVALSAVSGARPSRHPVGRVSRPVGLDVASRRMPLAVKLLGLGLGLLGLVYGLTLVRDHKSRSEPALTPAIGTNGLK